MRLKLSSRSSDLARIQAYQVAAALRDLNQNIEVEFLFRESLGDKNLTDPLWKTPEKGVFTSDFTADLVAGQTDMVVHSWKDLPTEVTKETFIAATLKRADQRDLLLLKKSSVGRKNLQIFSSSLRREYNLKNNIKDLLPFKVDSVQFASIRGNILTRMKKLTESTESDGLIVAKAALDRMISEKNPEFGEMQMQIREILKNLNWMALPLEINPNAAAQGALAIEIRRDNKALKTILDQINDVSSYNSAQKERDILSRYGGGCHQKIGIAVIHKDYGQVIFLKGLTDAGVVLDEKKLESNTEPFSQESSWSSSELNSKLDRKPINYSLPALCNALFVSKAEAWRDELSSFKGLVWAAGLKTWKKLAQNGVWVNGSNEGLGEKDLAQIGFVEHQLSWCKLTHKDATENDGMQAVETYELKPQGTFNKLDLSDKKTIFWSSGYWFKTLTAQHPELMHVIHCCGPGNTYKTIKETLSKNNLNIKDNLRIFVSEDEWKKHLN